MVSGGITPFDRDHVTWANAHGKQNLVRDLEDGHVRNIYFYLTKLPPVTERIARLLALFKKELKIRKLKPLKRQVPYKDPDGNLRVWSFKSRRPVRIENMKEPW